MGTNSNNKLDEKDFIQDGGKRPLLPSWIFTLITIAVLSTIWLVGMQLTQLVSRGDKPPFLQVTNRDFSLFLWENPDYMRGVYYVKTGYLPAFSSLKRVVNSEKADKTVVAPPEVLFRYHTWNRLVSSYDFPRPIPLRDFEDFLLSDKQWQPKFWPVAPEGYIDLIQNLGIAPQDLQSLPSSSLPTVVRKAFRGWENHFREGEAINAVAPKYSDMESFLKKYPHYARNFWRNLFPNYLKSMTSPDYNPDDAVPNEEFPAFLRVAYFNAK